MAKLDEPLQRLATGRQQRRATPAEWHEALLWAATRTMRQGALAAVDSDWRRRGLLAEMRTTPRHGIPRPAAPAANPRSRPDEGGAWGDERGGVRRLSS